MIKITTWKPDTCDCVIEYEWDDTTGNDTRVHKIKDIPKSCVHHKNLDKVGGFKQVVEENQNKNRVLGLILENMPEVTELVGEGGSKARKLKEGYEYEWSFDVDRNLRVKLKGLSTSQKPALQDLVDGSLGTGKVKVL